MFDANECEVPEVVGFLSGLKLFKAFVGLLLVAFCEDKCCVGIPVVDC